MSRFQVVPASYVYLIRSGPVHDEVLLQLRRNTGYMDDHWAAGAAGHVEQGETAYDAARREALEELGLADLDLTFEFTMQRSNNTAGAAFDPIEERIDFFFTSMAWAGEPTVRETEKVAELAWFPLDALPTPVVPHELYALSQIGSGRPYVTFGFS